MAVAAFQDYPHADRDRDRDRAKSHLATYYQKMGETPPWDR